MMRKRIIGALCALTVCGALSAQGKFIHKNGYKGTVELGYAAGAGDVAHNRMELLTVHGFQLNKNFSLGIGTGLQVWQVSDDITIPIFLDAEALLPKGVISPFASIRLGYVVNTRDEFFFPKQGVYFNPSVGFRWAVEGNKAFRLNVGYLLQSSDFIHNAHLPYNQFSERIFFHALSAKVSFEF